MNRAGLARRLIPIAVVFVAVALFFAFGLDAYLSLDAVRQRDAALHAFVDRRPIVAGAAFVLAYVLVVGLSLPGATVMTLTGGILFGLWPGLLLSLVSSTFGAIVVFLIARHAIGDMLRARAGSFTARMADGFRRSAFNYLLFLRLVPLFPFWAVNLAPALLGVRLRTFATATAIGIIPGTAAYAAVGDSLGRYLSASMEDPLSQAFSLEVVAVRSALALLALLPVAIQWARARHRA